MVILSQKKNLQCYTRHEAPIIYNPPAPHIPAVVQIMPENISTRLAKKFSLLSHTVKRKHYNRRGNIITIDSDTNASFTIANLQLDTMKSTEGHFRYGKTYSPSCNQSTIFSQCE